MQGDLQPLIGILNLQVLPDYQKGLFSSVPASQPSEQQLQQVSKLALLQHRAKGHSHLPSV